MLNFQKMFKGAAVLAMSCGALAGCGTDTNTDIDTQNEEIISNLVEAGYQAEDIMVVDDQVFVQKDAHVTLEASREMLQIAEGSTEEQYRTSNLVGSSVSTICIVPNSSFSGYSKFIQGLDMAIQNYNNLGLRLRFQRGGSGCTATISARTTSGSGGSAGFPSGGRPYSVINIGTGLNSYDVNVVEHVITHELGHCIGFRHSDYYNRAISCGSGGNEGTAGVGAIHIPGTPTTATRGGSLMNACFSSSSTGEFTSSDVTALNYLY